MLAHTDSYRSMESMESQVQSSHSIQNCKRPFSSTGTPCSHIATLQDSTTSYRCSLGDADPEGASGAALLLARPSRLERCRQWQLTGADAKRRELTPDAPSPNVAADGRTTESTSAQLAAQTGEQTQLRRAAATGSPSGQGPLSPPLSSQGSGARAPPAGLEQQAAPKNTECRHTDEDHLEERAQPPAGQGSTQERKRTSPALWRRASASRPRQAGGRRRLAKGSSQQAAAPTLPHQGAEEPQAALGAGATNRGSLRPSPLANDHRDQSPSGGSRPSSRKEVQAGRSRTREKPKTRSLGPPRGGSTQTPKRTATPGPRALCRPPRGHECRTKTAQGPLLPSSHRARRRRQQAALRWAGDSSLPTTTGLLAGGAAGDEAVPSGARASAAWPPARRAPRARREGTLQP